MSIARILVTFLGNVNNSSKMTKLVIIIQTEGFTVMIHFLMLRMRCFLIIVSMRNMLGILSSFRQTSFDLKITRKYMLLVGIKCDCSKYSNLRKTKLWTYLRVNTVSLN